MGEGFGAGKALNEFNRNRTCIVIKHGQGVVLDVERHRKRKESSLENNGNEKQNTALRISKEGLEFLNNEGSNSFEHGRTNRGVSA